MSNQPPLSSSAAQWNPEQSTAVGLDSSRTSPATGLNGFVPGRLGALQARTPSRRPLTEREKQILRLVCDGMTNAQIAGHLGIAADTVKSELKRIFRKISVKNRTQAAMHLVRQGLL